MLDLEIFGQTLRFETDPSLFSPRGADRGTLAMLSQVAFEPGQRVLDLGCGWGLVGVYAAKLCGAENVVLCDIDARAAAVAAKNAALNGVGGALVVVSDGFRQLDETGFDWILSNPPYHADFSVAKHFIEKGFNRLKLGGKLVMVTKRRDWYQNKLTVLFGGARVVEAEDYFVFIAERRGQHYAGGRIDHAKRP